MTHPFNYVQISSCRLVESVVLLMLVDRNASRSLYMPH